MRNGITITLLIVPSWLSLNQVFLCVTTCFFQQKWIYPKVNKWKSAASENNFMLFTYRGILSAPLEEVSLIVWLFLQPEEAVVSRYNADQLNRSDKYVVIQRSGTRLLYICLRQCGLTCVLLHLMGMSGHAEHTRYISTSLQQGHLPLEARKISLTPDLWISASISAIQIVDNYLWIMQWNKTTMSDYQTAKNYMLSAVFNLQFRFL